VQARAGGAGSRCAAIPANPRSSRKPLCECILATLYINLQFSDRPIATQRQPYCLARNLSTVNDTLKLVASVFRQYRRGLPVSSPNAGEIWTTGISVADAGAAFEAAVGHGAVAVQPPTTLADEATGTEQTVAEVSLYGDVVMRFVSGSFQVGHSDKPACPGRSGCSQVQGRG